MLASTICDVTPTCSYLVNHVLVAQKLFAQFLRPTVDLFFPPDRGMGYVERPSLWELDFQQVAIHATLVKIELYWSKNEKNMYFPGGC